MTTKTRRVDWNTQMKCIAPTPGTRSMPAWQVNTVTYGENIKDWRKRIRDCRSATTSLDGVRYELYAKPFEYRLRVGSVQHLYSGKLMEFTSWPAPPSSLLVNQAQATAQQKFAKKVNQRLTTWQGGVFAGELREAAKMLASPTARLRKETYNLLEQMLFMKRKFRKDPMGLEKQIALEGSKALSSLRNAVSDTWLEWAYGVKPTVQDCQDAFLAFRKLAMGRRVDTLRFNVTEKVEAFSNTEVAKLLGIYPGCPSVVVVDERRVESAEVTIRGAYVYRNPDGNFPIPKLFGISLSDLAPTAYELIPWSFLVDYFTDVGSAIEAASVRLVDMAYVTTTTRSSATHMHVNPRCGSSIPSAEVWCPHKYVTKLSYHRTIRQAGFPTMQLYIPQFKVPGMGTKWLNMAALLNGLAQLKR